MPRKTTNVSAAIADDFLYVTYPAIREALPSFMREQYQEPQLARQSHNLEFYLPFYKAPKHHAPRYWKVSQLLGWIKDFPIPDQVFLDFAGAIRARASVTAPVTPLRKSLAGRRARRRA